MIYFFAVLKPWFIMKTIVFVWYIVCGGSVSASSSGIFSSNRPNNGRRIVQALVRSRKDCQSNANSRLHYRSRDSNKIWAIWRKMKCARNWSGKSIKRWKRVEFDGK